MRPCSNMVFCMRCLCSPLTVFMDLGAFFHHLPAALRVLAQRRYRDALGLPAAAGAIAGTAAATGLGSGPAPGYQAADQAQLHFQLEQQQHQQAAWLAGTPAAAATAASAAALLLPDPASELMRARLIDMGLHMLGWFAAAPANTWPLTLARLRVSAWAARPARPSLLACVLLLAACRTACLCLVRPALVVLCPPVHGPRWPADL